MIAFAARYGRQPLPVLKAMSLSELMHFNNALSRIVEQENDAGEDT